MYAIDSHPQPLEKISAIEKEVICNGPNNTIQTNKHGLYEKNDNHYILWRKRLSIPSTCYATWSVEMQSLPAYTNPSISLFPVNNGNIPTTPTTNHAMVCVNKQPRGNTHHARLSYNLFHHSHWQLPHRKENKKKLSTFSEAHLPSMQKEKNSIIERIYTTTRGLDKTTHPKS